MVTVAVLGHRGLLGQTVARYFAEQGADVRTTDLRYTGRLADPLVAWAAGHDLIINAIVDRAGDPVTNSLLPLQLGEAGRLIHPSTDAYREQTPYARSKRAGDRAQAVIIRAGITDPRALPAVAYTNWSTNPLTPLEWARAAWMLRDLTPTVVELGREPLTRYDVVSTVAAEFAALPPRPARANQPICRVLPLWRGLPPLAEALAEYRRWLR